MDGYSRKGVARGSGGFPSGLIAVALLALIALGVYGCNVVASKVSPIYSNGLRVGVVQGHVLQVLGG